MKRPSILGSFLAGALAACNAVLEAEFIENARTYARNAYRLGKEVLGFDRFCMTQKEWSKWLSGVFSFKPQRRAFGMYLAPRETFKSTFFVVTFAIAALLANPNLTILIAGETQGNADAHLREIKSKIESEQFRKTFGNWVSTDCWRDDAINVLKRTEYSKEANIETAGIGKSLTGKHYDLIICDDIVGSEDRDSAAKREDTFNFFNGLFDVLKKQSGCQLITGTRWHREDLYAHVIDKLAPDMERKGVGKYHIMVVPAHDKVTGQINYPDLLPEQKLLEMRVVKQGKDGVDVSTFMAQYELDPLSDAEQIFKAFTFINHNGLKFSKLSQWTDPAMSEKKDSDYSAIIVAGRILEGEHQGKALALYASIDRRQPTKVIEDHNRIYRMFRTQFPDVEYQVNMEENGFQGLKDFAKDKSLRDGLEPVPTRGRCSTENKDVRIKSIEPAVTTGMLVFREDWATAPENYCLLMEQLKNYPQVKKDGPDALHGAYKYLSKSGTQIL